MNEIKEFAARLGVTPEEVMDAMFGGWKGIVRENGRKRKRRKLTRNGTLQLTLSTAEAGVLEELSELLGATEEHVLMEGAARLLEALRDAEKTPWEPERYATRSVVMDQVTWAAFHRTQKRKPTWSADEIFKNAVRRLEAYL